MLHLYKSPTTKKYEIASVRNGKYIIGSKQGYENKEGCYTALRAAMGDFESKGIVFQDNTLKVPRKFVLGVIKGTYPIAIRSPKPPKRYQP